MTSIVILTSASDSPLPTLGLLPHHVIIAPMTPQSLADYNTCNLVILDGVRDLVAAKNMANLLNTAKLPVPVVLALTGAEALYADMGHFGRKPIQLAWSTLVLPGLAPRKARSSVDRWAAQALACALVSKVPLSRWPAIAI